MAPGRSISFPAISVQERLPQSAPFIPRTSSARAGFLSSPTTTTPAIAMYTTVEVSSSKLDLLTRLPSLQKNQGMEIDADKVQVLEFFDLSYQVTKVMKNEAGRRENVKADILRGISGRVCTGELTGIIGPSGAGKSSLVDALVGHIRPESLEGSVLLNGEPASLHIRQRSALVQQDDELFPMLTVEETLLFSAGVRLPKSVPMAEKQTRVQQLLHQLGLEGVASSYIGNANRRGISGGERRRVSIGVDIIHDPAILFLDEPTSGLDSSAAFSVFERLQMIARAGSLVVCTLHQPSFRILDLLDNLLVLAQGQVAYLGAPSGLLPRLEEAGAKVPPRANESEVVIDLLQPKADGESLQIMDRLFELNRIEWANHMQTKDKIAAPTVSDKVMSLAHWPGVFTRKSFANDFFTELWWIMWRSWLNVQRTPALFFVRTINIVMTGILLSTLFWRPNIGNKGVSNLLSFIIFSISLVYFTSNDALAVYLQERLIFIKESSHYSYRTSSYVVGNMLVMLPFFVFFSFIFTTICWWSVHLAGDINSFLFWVFVLFCVFFTANSFTSFLSAVVPGLEVGNTVALSITAYFLLLSGFFVDCKEIPGYWIWAHYLSNFKWPYQALALEQFSREDCYERDAQNVCVLSGRDVILNLAVDEFSKWTCCIILLVQGAAYRMGFYIALLRSSRSKRK